VIRPTLRVCHPACPGTENSAGGNFDRTDRRVPTRIRRIVCKTDPFVVLVLRAWDPQISDAKISAIYESLYRARSRLFIPLWEYRQSFCARHRKSRLSFFLKTDRKRQESKNFIKFKYLLVTNSNQNDDFLRLVLCKPLHAPFHQSPADSLPAIR
jgi:hypothetical protein